MCGLLMLLPAVAASNYTYPGGYRRWAAVAAELLAEQSWHYSWKRVAMISELPRHSVSVSSFLKETEQCLSHAEQGWAFLVVNVCYAFDVGLLRLYLFLL